MGLVSRLHPTRALIGAWQFGLFVLAVRIHQVIALNFNTYGPCEGLQHGNSVPQCRIQRGIPGRQQAVAVSAVPQQLAVDMRLPCEDADTECHEVRM